MVGNCVLWERSGEGGYVRMIRSTGVALYNRGGSGANEGKRTFLMADVFETMLV